MIRLFKNIWLILTLDCQGSAELTSQSFDRQLRWPERIAVWFHCLICSKSRKLNTQLSAINTKLEKVLSSEQASAQFSLSSEAKLRIQEKLDQARDAK